MSSLLKSVLIATLISSVAISPALAQRQGYRGGGVHVSGGWNALTLALFGTVLYLAATTPPPPHAPAPVYPAQVYTPQGYEQQLIATNQAAPQPAPVAEQNWWYYCGQANGYYPYVKTCPTGWTRVSPVPPGQ